MDDDLAAIVADIRERIKYWTSQRMMCSNVALPPVPTREERQANLLAAFGGGDNNG